MTEWFSFHFQKFSPIPWVSFLFCWLCPLIHISSKFKNLLDYSYFTILCFCCTVEWISYMYTFLLFSCSVVSDSLPLHGLQYTRLPCPLPSPRSCSGSCPLNQWCHPTIWSYVILFSSCLQSFTASGSLLMSWLFTSGGQSIGASASIEYSGLISFGIDWFDLLAVKGTLKSLLQHHSSEASILWWSTLLIQVSHPYMTGCEKNLLDLWLLCGQSNVFVFNLLSRFVVTFLPRSKCLFISCLQSHSAVILEPKKIVCHCRRCFPNCLPWSDGTGCHDLSFLNVKV